MLYNIKITLCLFLITCFLFSKVFAEENISDPQDNTTLSPETAKSITNKIAMNYRIPMAHLPDSVNQIRLQVKFTVDQNGEIKDPIIVNRNMECNACEKELKRVIKSLPAIDPIISNGRPVKVQYTLPFVIQLQ